jgi:hypothetical protein
VRKSFPGWLKRARAGPDGRNSELNAHLRALGLSLDPANSSGDGLSLLSFDGIDGAEESEDKNTLRFMRDLRQKFGLEFYLPAGGAKAGEKTALEELSQSRPGGGLKIVLGKDFVEQPAALLPRLEKLAALLADKSMNVPGLSSRVVAMNLSTGRIKRELIGGEGATSGPAMWIRNRMERFGVHVYVDDGEFGPGKGFAAFSRGTDVYLRSSALSQLEDEKTMRIIGHELHHASSLAKCLKSTISLAFTGCEQLISFFSEKGGGLFGFFQREGDLTKFPGYAKYFRSDELEAYKISKNPEHALEMASRQLPWLKQLKEEIAAGNPEILKDLRQKLPLVHFKSADGIFLKVGFPVNHEFATEKEAQDFYVNFLDKRIHGIEVIDNVVDHPTGLGQPHYNFIRQFWDKHFSEG